MLRQQRALNRVVDCVFASVAWDNRNQRRNCVKYTNPRPKNALQLVLVDRNGGISSEWTTPPLITIGAGVGWFRRAVRYSLGSRRSLLRMAVLTTSLCLVLLLTVGLSHEVSANGDGDGSVVAPKDDGATKAVDGATPSSSNLPTAGSPSDNTDSTTDSPGSLNGTTQSPDPVTIG